jgi:protein-L-isoaspartate O-methyltransferase
MNGHRPAITSAALVWRPHAIHLAGQLVHAGVLTDGAWRNAVLAVPRHHFVPGYFQAADRTRWRHHRCPDPDSAAARDWLAHVYDRIALIVALSAIDSWGRQHPVAISPDPTLTMRLLHTLDVRTTDRVLELGTGSGHTTALLAHRVGADQVTSVEIDTELHHLAAHHLSQLDLHPHLVLTDSTTLDAPLHCTTPDPSAASAGDLPAAASARTNHDGFDRVLVGHTVDHIPAAWLRHTNPGALVLATLVGGLGAGHPSSYTAARPPRTQTRSPATEVEAG